MYERWSSGVFFTQTKPPTGFREIAMDLKMACFCNFVFWYLCFVLYFFIRFFIILMIVGLVGGGLSHYSFPLNIQIS